MSLGCILTSWHILFIQRSSIVSKGFNFNLYRYEKTFHHTVQHPSRKASSVGGYRVSSTVCCAIQDYPLLILVQLKQIYIAVPCEDVTAAPSLLTSDSPFQDRQCHIIVGREITCGWGALHPASMGYANMGGGPPSKTSEAYPMQCFNRNTKGLRGRGHPQCGPWCRWVWLLQWPPPPGDPRRHAWGGWHCELKPAFRKFCLSVDTLPVRGIACAMVEKVLYHIFF